MVYHEISQTGDIVFCSEEFFQWLIEVLKFGKEQKILSPITMDYTMVMRSEVSPLPDRKGKPKLRRYSDEMESHIFASSRNQYSFRKEYGKESKKKSSQLCSLVAYRPKRDMSRSEVDSKRVRSKAYKDRTSETTKERKSDVKKISQALSNEATDQSYSSAYPFIWDTKEEEEEDNYPVKRLSSSSKTLHRSNPEEIQSLSENNSSQSKVHQSGQITANLVEGTTINDGYLDMPDFDDLLDTWCDNKNSSHNAELLAIAERINKNAMMEETTVGETNLQTNNLGNVASSNESNLEKRFSDDHDHDQSALHNNCQSDERESVKELKSVTPLHLDKDTSFLFSQPYFPGYYSPALWNSNMSENVNLNITSPVLPTKNLGQQELKEDNGQAYCVHPKRLKDDDEGRKYATSKSTSTGIVQSNGINSQASNNIQIAHESRNLAESPACISYSSAVKSNASFENDPEFTSKSIDIENAISAPNELQSDLNFNSDFCKTHKSKDSPTDENGQKKVENDEECKSMATPSCEMKNFNATTCNEMSIITCNAEKVSVDAGNEGRSLTNTSDSSRSSEIFKDPTYQYDTHSKKSKRQERTKESSDESKGSDSAHVGKDSESYEKKRMSKERQWVQKMANERGINVDDYDYKDLRKKFLDEYYRKQNRKKAMAKTQTKEHVSRARKLSPSELTSSMTGHVEMQGNETDFSSLAKGVEWRSNILAAEEKSRAVLAPSFTSE